MTHMSLKRAFYGWVWQIFHDTSIHIMVHAIWKLKHSYTIMDTEDNVVLCSTFCVLSSDNRLDKNLKVMILNPRYVSTLVKRRVWRYHRGNQNSYIVEKQTTQWPKEKVQKEKQWPTNMPYGNSNTHIQSWILKIMSFFVLLSVYCLVTIVLYVTLLILTWFITYRAYHSCTCSRQCCNINPSSLPRLLDLILIPKHQSKRPSIYVHQSKADNSAFIVKL
jgi:hypothetical protein